MPGRIIGETDETIVYQSPYGPLREVSSRGTLEEWKEHVAKYCVGNSRLLFSVATAFAAPLMEWLQVMGVIIHWTGETTNQYVALSTYGGHEQLCKWATTISGLEPTVVAHDSILLVLDEYGLSDPEEAGRTAYLLADGQGKTRSLHGDTNRPVKTWRVLALSSGEEGLAEMMAEAGKRLRGGMEMRMLEIAADKCQYGTFDTLHGYEKRFKTAKRAGQEFSKYLRMDATADYHDTALPAFIEELQRMGKPAVVEWMKAKMKKWLDDYLPEDASPQVGRAADNFALVSASGELATQLGITGWEEGAAEEASVLCFDAWLDKRGGTGSSDERRMLAQVKKFIQEFGETRFETHYEKCKVGKRAGFRIYKEDEKPPHKMRVVEYWVLSGPFRDEMCRGFDSAQVAELLYRRGVLKQRRFKRDGRVITERCILASWENGKQRVYKIKAEVLALPD